MVSESQCKAYVEATPVQHRKLLNTCNLRIFLCQIILDE